MTAAWRGEAFCTTAKFWETSGSPPQVTGYYLRSFEISVEQNMLILASVHFGLYVFGQREGAVRVHVDRP